MQVLLEQGNYQEYEDVTNNTKNIPHTLDALKENGAVEGNPRARDQSDNIQVS